MPQHNWFEEDRGGVTGIEEVMEDDETASFVVSTKSSHGDVGNSRDAIIAPNIVDGIIGKYTDRYRKLITNSDE